MKYGYVYMKVWICRLPIGCKGDCAGKWGKGVTTFRKGICFLVCLGYVRTPRIYANIKNIIH